MLPITCATLQHFCRICLRELPKSSETSKEPNHDISKSFLKTLNLITGPEGHFSSLFPKTLCHSCYVKTNALKDFRDKSIIATGVLKMLTAEVSQEATIAKLKAFCRSCLKKLNSRNGAACSTKAEKIYENMLECTGLRLGSSKNDVIIDALNDEETFPQNICAKCNATLKNFMDFRAINKQTNEYLRGLLYGVKEKQSFKSQIDNAVNIKEEIIEIANSAQDDPKHQNNTDNAILDFETSDEVKIEIQESANSWDDISIKSSPCHENSNDADFDVNFFESEDPFSTNSIKAENQESFLRTPIKEEINLGASSNETLSSKRTRLKRINIEKPKSTFKCLECNKSFYKEHMYKAHNKTVHEGIEKPFACELCPSSFRFLQVLNRHINEKHTNMLPPMPDSSLKGSSTTVINSTAHVCMYCQRPFKRKDHMKEHVRAVHEQLRPYSCKICGKAFSSRNTQVRHEQNHSEERPFACEYCGKRYNSESELKVHIQRHTTKPELLCPICKRAKSNAEELQQHIAMHQASRQNQCPKCGKIFTKTHHLYEHDMTVHLKLRPFKCKYCDKTFGVRKTLRTHERSHDPTGQPELCNLCNLHFKSKRALILHTKKMHPSQQ